MLYVALAEALALAVVAIVFGNLLRVTQRQASRERDLLVNQLCNLAGRPWAEPPSFRAPEVVPEPDTWAIPEQMVS